MPDIKGNRKQKQKNNIGRQIYLIPVKYEQNFSWPYYNKRFNGSKMSIKFLTEGELTCNVLGSEELWTYKGICVVSYHANKIFF